MLSQIVVSIDGSSDSEKAFEFGCELARKFSSGLHLLHVVSERQVPEEIRHMAEIEHLVPAPKPRPDVSRGVWRGIAQGMNTLEARSQSTSVLETVGEHLLRSCSDDAKEKGIKQVKTALLHGDPATEIVSYLKSCKADAIIVGSRGLSKLEKLLLGSVSQKLSQHAPCTCIAVR